MPTGHDSSPPLQPLIERLQSELRQAGVAVPESAPEDSQAFSSWYLAAIQVLEQRVASGEGHPPMTHREVELLCRCAISGRDLAEAIQCVVDFCDMLHPRAGRTSLQLAGQRAVFEMDSMRQQPSGTTCLVDLTGLYSYLQLFGWLIDEPLQPSQVVLGHPRREDAAAFLGLFDAPVIAGGRCYRFEFDAALLRRAVVRQPRELEGFLHSFPCDILGRSTERPLLAQIQTLLQAAIYQGAPAPEATAVANALGMSTTTLRRQLAAAGVGFRQLRENALQQAAKESLSQTRQPVEQIALRLGFSDGTAFRRAFRRWTGVAPSEWRAQHNTSA